MKMKKRYVFNIVRKNKRKNPLEDSRQLINLAKQSSRDAIKGLHQAGISISYIKNGQLIKRSPGDQETTLKSPKSDHKKISIREYLCQD